MTACWSKASPSTLLQYFHFHGNKHACQLDVQTQMSSFDPQIGAQEEQTNGDKGSGLCAFTPYQLLVQVTQRRVREMKPLLSWGLQSNRQKEQEGLEHKTEEQGKFSNSGDKPLSYLNSAAKEFGE